MEEPHVEAFCKDGTKWCLPLDAMESFTAAWMGGKAFWEGTGLWDDWCIIKLGDITGVCMKTANGLALTEAEAEEERSRKLLQGDGG